MCLFVVTLLCATPGETTETSPTNPKLEHYSDTIEIPFAYPNRPTVYAQIGGIVVPLLFDTGTNMSILLDTGENSLPPGLVFSEDQAVLAQLDGKPVEWVQSGYLRYARSKEVILGNSRPLDIQFRIYKAEPDPDRDFQGALSPQTFAETHLIEVINSDSKIHLTHRDQWVPTDHSSRYPLIFPMKVENNGVFLKLWIDDYAYWFQFDTGFSAEIAVTPESNLGFGSTEDQLVQHSFEGWGEPFELRSWILDDQSVGFLKYYSTGGRRIASVTICGCYLLPEGFLREQTSFELSGIVGAAFLREHKYVLDFSEQTIYLSLNPDINVLSGNPWPILPGYRNQ